jgi:hypothetical protein
MRKPLIVSAVFAIASSGAAFAGGTQHQQRSGADAGSGGYSNSADRTYPRGSNESMPQSSANRGVGTDAQMNRGVGAATGGTTGSGAGSAQGGSYPQAGDRERTFPRGSNESNPESSANRGVTPAR